MFEECRTIVDIIYYVQKTSADMPFLKYRKDKDFQTITFKEFLGMTERLTAAFYEIGIRKNDKIGIVSDNLYKWLLTDMAILSLGAADVPRGSDSTINSTKFR